MTVAAPRVRFDRSARYGVSIGTMVFATYLTAATDFSAIIQASNFAGSIGSDVPQVNLVEGFTIMALYIASACFMPVNAARRVSAATFAYTMLLVWAELGIQRGTGNLGANNALLEFVLNQGMLALVIAIVSWLILRRRHPISYVVVLVALVPGFESAALTAASASTAATALVVQLSVAVLGTGAVWLAAAIDSGVRRQLERRGNSREPVPTTAGTP
jgi:hypothetical protein